ncbi:MAG: hypothetical protein ACFFDK_02395 [Promethearchaeota archaeon]
MQSIKGKKEGLLRVLGMVLILISVLATIIFDFFLLDLTTYILAIVVFMAWFVLIVLLKLEKDFFVDNASKFFVGLGIFSAIIIIIAWMIGVSALLLFIMVIFSDILIIFCWHFALTIFKKKKVVFLIGGIGYCIITALFRVLSFIALNLILGAAPLLLVILGICLIILAEFRMKKKGLLNYV